MELGSDENMGKENVPKCGHDPKQNLQQMLQRQANFIKTCRTVKVVTSVILSPPLCVRV